MQIYTSIYFCPQSEHSSCRHGELRYLKENFIITTELDEVIKQIPTNFKKLAHDLRNKEIYYQKALEQRLNMQHTSLNKQNITDLSDMYNIIEIKNVANFREAVGQIEEYACLHRMEYPHVRMNKFIVLFGDSVNVSPERWKIWQNLTAKRNIKLLYAGSAIHFLRDYLRAWSLKNPALTKR